MTYTQMQIQRLLEEITVGGNVLVVYYGRFPKTTYEACSDHALCQEKTADELKFSNGAKVKFHDASAYSPSKLLEPQQLKITDFDWSEEDSVWKITDWSNNAAS